MFHFGGSSHALIFGPKVEVTFVNAEVNRYVKVNSIIAYVNTKDARTSRLKELENIEIELAASYKVKDGNSAEVLERAEDDLKKAKQKLSECQSKRDRLIELQYLRELAKKMNNQ